jgi:hypothetical protein
MGNRRGAYGFIVGKHERKRLVGRPVDTALLNNITEAT